MKCKLQIKCGSAAITWLADPKKDELIIRAGMLSGHYTPKIRTIQEVCRQGLEVLERWANEGKASGYDLARLQITLEPLAA